MEIETEKKTRTVMNTSSVSDSSDSESSVSCATSSDEDGVEVEDDHLGHMTKDLIKQALGIGESKNAMDEEYMIKPAYHYFIEPIT